MLKRDKKGKSGITLIAENCTLSGNVHFSDELSVNGVIQGDVIAEPGSKAKVTVSERGRVEGDIRVPNIVVNGEVDGNIYSDKHVELAAKACIKGNVYYHLIEMVMGSRVDGNLVHVKAGAAGGQSEAKKSGLKAGVAAKNGQKEIDLESDSTKLEANVSSIGT